MHFNLPLSFHLLWFNWVFYGSISLCLPAHQLYFMMFS
jgi:hypothetical protein